MKIQMEIKQHIDAIQHGRKPEAQLAKKALVKALDKKLAPNWKSTEQAIKDREIFSKEMLAIYKTLYGTYKSIENHNKCVVLSFLSHALFFFEDNHEHFETFLEYVREALKDATDGSLRHIAVMTSSNTYALSTMGIHKSPDKKIAAKQKKISDIYQNIITHHITAIFDYLETYIETDEHEYKGAVEHMKSSVVKSHLLYLFKYDRFDVLTDLSGLYEEEIFHGKNEYYTRWRTFYEPIVQAHPNIKKFIQHVPRFDIDKYDEPEYEEDDIITLVQTMINAPEPDGILSSDFFAGIQSTESWSAPGGFSIPKDAYFEISEIIQNVDDRAMLFEIFTLVHQKAKQLPVSEIYWYDLVDSILSQYGDRVLRLQMLEEALERVSVKVDVCAPIQKDDKNNIHYGIHEHRPIYRLLVAYALCQHDYGDLEIAKQYYQFLLKLNPYDNQGVRYLLAALYAEKPASYTDELFVEGNKSQNWDKVENFLNEHNAKHHFWNRPEETK
jgi:hypothetical protein